MFSPSSSKSVSMTACFASDENIFSTMSSMGFPEMSMILLNPSDLIASLSFLPSTIISMSGFLSTSLNILSKSLGENIIT